MQAIEGNRATAATPIRRLATMTGVFVLATFVARGGLEMAAPDSPWRVPLALLPVPAFAALLWAIVGSVRSLDELDRRIHFEALAIAFPLATVLLLVLGLLDLAITLPRDDWSYRHVWYWLPVFYAVGLAISRRRYR